VIPIAWLVSLVYTSRNIGSFLFGKSRAPLLPLILVFVFFVGAGSCDSFDIYENDGDRTKIPALVENLSHGDRDVRSLSLSVLRKLSPYDEATASAILQAMQDPDDQVQSNAISLASQLGPFAVRAVPILVEKFTKNGSCTFELAELGPVAKDAIPALEEQLPSTKGYNKLGIARALWSINRNSKLIVPVLIELLQDDFGPIRVDAATLLGEIGPDAKDAAPVLQKMIDYQPKADLNPPNETTDKPSSPVIRQMSEAEFYPQIRSAAETALQKILGTK
jgi:HEAT repeat protein